MVDTKESFPQIVTAGEDRYERNLARVVKVLEDELDHLETSEEYLAEKILAALALDSYNPRGRDS